MMSCTSEPVVHTIFEPVTGTWQYIVADPSSKHAVIIDSVLDFDLSTFTLSTSSADSLISLVQKHNYTIDRILETHAHADHITAAHYLRTRLSTLQPPSSVFPPKICIGHRITQVQRSMAEKYNIPASEHESAFDHLFADDETFAIGALTAKVLYLPGHTPDHIGYMVGSNVFTGDSIFNPDVGSARTDFPLGSAAQLWASMQRLLGLPAHYRLYTGHDYPPAGRGREGARTGTGSRGEEEESGGAQAWATVEEHLRGNKHVKRGTVEEEFVKWRRERDEGLKEPRLMHQALQMNVRGGRVPEAKTSGGGRFLLVPLVVPEVML